MNFKQAIAGLTLAGLIAGLVPAAPALADGRASTRNIFLGLGAATYLIIQHNRKVHQRYAEDARRQAYAEQQANDAQAAYASERTAYENEAAANSELRQEVAYQHNVILKQDRELAMAPVRRGFITPDRTVSYRSTSRGSRGTRSTRRVAMVDYGWGAL